MKRWNIANSCEAENIKIDEYLAEIIEVSKRHGLSIGNEDPQCGLIVCEFSHDNAELLMHAADDTRS